MSAEEEARKAKLAAAKKRVRHIIISIPFFLLS
jgi:hypothetical protein